MAEWTVAPSKSVRGRLRVPGDKSISHRAAMLGALASGESRISGFLSSEDCLNTLNAVEALGAGVRRDGNDIRIAGVGGRFRPPSRLPLDMGNSGTGIRLLCGLLAGHDFETVLTGDESLRSRPMGRIREPLELMGARLELTGPKGTAPIRIRGGALLGIEYRPPMASAQVKSCVLFAGLFAAGRTTVREIRRTRDHTERMLAAFGVPLSASGMSVSVEGAGAARPRLAPLEIMVPGDFSSAAFWLAAAACRPGNEVRIDGIGLNPGRTAFLEVLRRMGAGVEARVEFESGNEPIGSVTVRGARLRGTSVGGDEIPGLIDELPVISVLGALSEGVTVIADAAELRVKESDRIAVMAGNLRAVGVDVEERPDGMAIHGGRPRGGKVSSFLDHRVAMSFAVLGLCADGPVVVDGVECVATSYPGFMDHLGMLTGAHT